MKPRPAIIELVVADMAATLAFYRRLGLDIPPEADSEPHVGVELGAGISLMWDTEDTIRSFDPGWSAPAQPATAPRWDLPATAPLMSMRRGPT